ncbi:hypothetical protein HDU88_007348 [Geranomyces variabilis]|nr:hypothetical protein HDU88_007348 [Geranomyces variabilis]
MTSISLVPANLRLGGAEVTDEFVAAYVQVYQDELDADSQFQPSTLPPTTSTLLSRANRVARFYGQLPVSAATARHLLDGPNGFFLTEAFQRCQTHPYGKLANFSQRFTEIGRTVKLEADLESPVTEVHASQPLGLELYIKQISVYINKWKELLEKHLTFRPGDRVWVQLLLNNPPQIPNHDRAYLYYVGVTIRNPGLRLTEPMQPSAANSRQAAFVKAAELTGALHNMYMYEIVRKDIPTAASDRNKGLLFNLRTQPAICDMERFVRLLFHIRALNCSPGGIDHMYRLTEESETIIDDAVASAGVLLPENSILTGSGNPKSQQLNILYSQTMPTSLRNCLTDSETRVISSQLCDNLLMVPIGSGSPREVITARLGKAATGIKFYEVDKAGLGPQTHTRLVMQLYEKILATAPASPPNGNLAFLGPFCDVFESLEHLNDRVTVLFWLQQVLQLMRPWHIVTLGSPTLGVFVHSLLENTIVDPNSSGSTSSDTQRSRFGKPLDSRWDLFGEFVNAIGVPFITRYGPEADHYAVVTGSYHPGVLAHDYELSPLRHEISALVITQEGIITATIASALANPHYAQRVGQPLFRKILLVDTILPHIRDECEKIGLTARLDTLKRLVKIHAQHLQRVRRDVVDSGGGREPEDSTADSATAAERRRCEIIMQGTPAPLDADPSQARVTQVDGLVAARREMAEQFNARVQRDNLFITNQKGDEVEFHTTLRNVWISQGKPLAEFYDSKFVKLSDATHLNEVSGLIRELEKSGSHALRADAEQLIVAEHNSQCLTLDELYTLATRVEHAVNERKNEEERQGSVAAGHGSERESPFVCSLAVHVKSHGDPGFSDRSLVHKDRVLFLRASVLNDFPSLDFLDDDVDQGGHRDTPRVT